LVSPYWRRGSKESSKELDAGAVGLLIGFRLDREFDGV
jgi:hypothetical protein